MPILSRPGAASATPQQLGFAERMKAGRVVPILSDPLVFKLALGDYAAFARSYAEHVGYTGPDADDVVRMAKVYKHRSKLRDQVFHGEDAGSVFDKITHERPYSDATAKEIDDEVAALIKEADKRAEVVLNANRDVLERLKDELLKRETIEEDDAAELMHDVKAPKEALLY